MSLDEDSELERLREGWTQCDEEFDHFLDALAMTVPETWDGDLTPETVLAYVQGLALNHTKVLEEREQLRIENNTLTSDRQRLQFHLEEFISVTAGGVTNTSVAKGAPIWEVRQQAVEALRGKSWQHDFYYETIDRAAKADSLLRRVKADRPSAHSDALWLDICAFLAGDRA